MEVILDTHDVAPQPEHGRFQKVVHALSAAVEWSMEVVDHESQNMPSYKEVAERRERVRNRTLAEPSVEASLTQPDKEILASLESYARKQGKHIRITRGA